MAGRLFDRGRSFGHSFEINRDREIYPPSQKTPAMTGIGSGRFSASARFRPPGFSAKDGSLRSRAVKDAAKEDRTGTLGLTGGLHEKG